MGKGDKKSKRGKIFRGSFGTRRPSKVKKGLINHAKEIIEADNETKAPAVKKKIRTTVAR